MTSFADFEYDRPPEPQKPGEDFIKNAYDEYKNLDEGALEKKLFEEVKKQKESGNFNLPLLESSVESLKPFMDEKSYLNLKNLFDSIK